MRGSFLYNKDKIQKLLDHELNSNASDCIIENFKPASRQFQTKKQSLNHSLMRTDLSIQKDVETNILKQNLTALNPHFPNPSKFRKSIKDLSNKTGSKSLL